MVPARRWLKPFDLQRHLVLLAPVHPLVMSIKPCCLTLALASKRRTMYSLAS